LLFMLCPKCGSNEFEELVLEKGKQFKCKKCGYEGIMMGGLI